MMEAGNQVSLDALGGRLSIPFISSQDLNNPHKSIKEFE